MSKRFLNKACKKSGPRVLNLGDLIKSSDLIIEATQAEAAFGIAKKAILAGKDILVMSVGGIIKHCHELRVLAQKKGARIFIPSGAIAGIAEVRGNIKAVLLHSPNLGVSALLRVAVHFRFRVSDVSAAKSHAKG